MHELSRMAYLEAMGIDSYVSRHQLPGAAPTRRLRVARPGQVRPGPVESTGVESLPIPGAGQGAGAPRVPRLQAAPRVAAGQEAPQREVSSPAAAAATRFSLAAIVAGGFIWLEELEGRPLAREQVQLVHAMARAVAGAVEAPQVTQFDWPVHNNQQLDLTEEAARAGVAGFLQRRLEQGAIKGLILLGDTCQRRVPVDQLGGVNAIATLSTAQMLARPELKKQAWKDLLPLVHTVR